jgi:ribonuclease PH
MEPLAEGEFMRIDGRKATDLRPVKMETGVLDYAEGSCLITVGMTRVLCAATVETSTPRWMKDDHRGWVTAEYNMLPRSNRDRTRRERSGSVSGRTQEIQRLVGRSLRAVTDLSAMPGIMITLDCDVIQADGGTRTASITGAYVALVHALYWAKEKEIISRMPLYDYVAAISVGKHEGTILADLCYHEDSNAEVDANFVMTGRGKLVEIQGTAEDAPFSEKEFIAMMGVARAGIKKLVNIQKKAITPALKLARRPQ